MLAHGLHSGGCCDGLGGKWRLAGCDESLARPSLGDAFYTHLLARHWRRGEPYNGNHCSDGRIDRDETGIDTGGVCDVIGR
jgi:hypothetical protein